MILVRNLFIFLLSLGSFWAAGQQDTSTVDWSDTYHEELQKIENLEQQGQNRSAYRRANDLFEKAINANNIPGIVGSINLFIRNIYRVDDEASKTALVKIAKVKPDHPVVSAIINSYLAELLTQYYERNRYQISDIQEGDNLPWEDISRWSSTQMEQSIDRLYKLSIKSELLKDISSEKIRSLMEDQPGNVHFELRPRLYDLLQMRFLTYLKNKRLHWSLQKDLPDAKTVKMLTAIDLSNYLDTVDDGNRIYPVVRAYYEWETSLQGTGWKEAYVDVLLERIHFVNGYLGNTHIKSSIPLLASLTRTYSNVRNVLAIVHSLASVHFQTGDYSEALTILKGGLEEKLANAYPATIDQVRHLIRTINAPELNVQTEEAYPSDRTPLVSVHFRNMEKIRLELYPLTADEFVQWRFTRLDQKSDDFELTRGMKSIWDNTLELPESDDYKSHRTEVMIDRKLKKGAYALRYWYKKNDLKLSGIVLFQVTDLALIRTEDGQNSRLYVVDRTDGSRQKKANVEGVTIDRQPSFHRSEIRILSEKDGSFIPPERMLNAYYRVSAGDDLYISPLTYHRSSNRTRPQPFRRTVLLTDRSVYKPGQTIHFKALAVLSRQLDSEVLENQKIDVALRDANGKEVWNETYRTDEWGSVTGVIPIPVSGLKGRWTIQASPSGQSTILVEAYQRPRFEVEVPDSSIRRMGDTVTIGGRAMTYHGFPVQKGKGTVRVELQRRYWFYSMRPENGEVVHTATFHTDDDGQFQTTFEQVHPPQTGTRYGSFYFYNISISVQAASGDIREVNRSIPLDPDKVQVRAEVPSFQMLDSLAPVRFTVRNALEEPASREVHLVVSELETPEHYKVDRHWAVPDQPMYPAKRFRKRIDHFFFNHGASMEDWKERQQVKVWTQKVSDQDSIPLEEIIHDAGYYRFTVQSKEGDTLSMVSFGLAKEKGVSIRHAPMEIVASKNSTQPGETIQLNLFSPELMSGGQLIISRPGDRSEQYSLNRERSVSIKITEKDRGGLYVRAFGFLQNRFYEKTMTIDVPWRNKVLTVSGINSIDKVEVGKDTVLSISVVNNKNAGVQSKVGVVMYDASLDAYRPHNWTLDRPFFRRLMNPFQVNSVTGLLGAPIGTVNNYWNDRVNVEPLLLPRLPDLEMGYGRMLYARRSQNLMNKAVPEAMESISMDSESAGSMPSEVDNRTTEDGDASEQTPVRRDFNETILFSAKLQTDTSGNVRIPFQTNDKAGRWKILLFAHTQDLSSGVVEHTFETYQDLLLESFLPRMVRQGDQIDLTFTLYNNASKPISGQVQFEMKPLFDDDNSVPFKKNLGFDLEAGKSTTLSVPVYVGMEETGPLIFTAHVKDDAGKVWDSTEEVVPVYPAAETVYDGQVTVLEDGESWSGKDLPTDMVRENARVTVRIVQNMYSELMKSLPYLQYHNPVTTDQFFRNGMQAILGQYITNQIPDFEKIYTEWQRKWELESRLAQNQDKKYVTLGNTPWERQHNSGTEQMALLGLYFDELHMDQVVVDNMSKWIASQNQDGGFPWIKDGPSSFYITVRFLALWNKMDWVGVADDQLFSVEQRQSAQEYIDKEFLRIWKKMKKDSGNSTVYYQRFIPYFSQRAYTFDGSSESEDFLDAWGQLRDSIYANWSDYETGLRADIGIAAWYLGDKNLSKQIVAAFLDNAIRDPELGIYWRYNHQSRQNGYLGVLARITELLILHEETALDEGITQWVLVNKMTNDWHSNPHVTSLMLSLLKMNGNWTMTSRTEVVRNGEKKIRSGVGDGGAIELRAGELESFRINHLDGPPVWIGVVTSRLVEPEEEIAQSGDILQIVKTTSGSGESGSFQVGDQLTVRLVLTTDRDLDYVHIADPLVPGMDPGISLSGYQWQYGLSYYQSFGEKDAHFYINHLPKGEHILEYKLGVVRSGEFRSPYTTIQSYFVPEINGFDPWKSKVEISRKE